MSPIRRQRRSAPVIGIGSATDFAESGLFNLEAARKNSIPTDYIRSVEMAGGLPVILPVLQDPQLIEQLVERLDGLLLPGGRDINPVYYGQEPHPLLGRIDVERDRFESLLIPLALRQENLPILGICRGIQSLNVFAGGTLLQDVSLWERPVLKHQQETDRSVPTHTLLIEPHTRLRQIFRKRKILVTSYHHQVVDRVAPGFIVSGRSEDGLIEAIEKPGERFIVAVQTHPERLTANFPEFRKLFQAFVEAARGR